MSLLNSLGTLLSQGLSELEKSQAQAAQGGGAGMQPTDLLGQLIGGLTGAATNNAAGQQPNLLGQLLGGLAGKSGDVIAPTALGGLAGALLGNKPLSGAAGGALLMGGMQLWNIYKQRLQEANASAASGPTFGAVASTPDERVQRIIRSIVYAAKSDGHIDENEQQAINNKLAEMHLGQDCIQLVQQAMNEPLDPAKIAEGVKTADEALEIFTLSTIVLNIDNVMERAYLESLASALNIPQDVRDDMINKIKTPA